MPTKTKPSADKPPYCVPMMSKIAEVPYNGYKVVSTFAGAGGSSLGYRMAGFKVLWANEYDPPAQDTYRANYPTTILDIRDIRQVTADEILWETGLKSGELDVFDGSPPCTVFSTAGQREKAWGRSNRTEDLFFEYTRLLKGLQPKIFIAENVSGLVKGVAKGYFKLILAELKACGYKVKAQVLDAQWLGVPQMRARVIFCGVRNDLSAEPAFPKPLPYRYSVRDALPWILKVQHAGNSNVRHPIWKPSELPSPTCCSSGAEVSPTAYLSGGTYIEAETDISRFAIGKEWDNIEQGHNSEKFFNLARPDIDKSCPTITAQGGNSSMASVTHPTEKRKFSIAELRRIGSFPDDFILTGSYAEQWKRVGNSVPPVMMFHIATTVREQILDALKS